MNVWEVAEIPPRHRRKLDASPPYNWVRALRESYDETVRMPLWEFPPEAAKAVLHQRRRRGMWDLLPREDEGE